MSETKKKTVIRTNADNKVQATIIIKDFENSIKLDMEFYPADLLSPMSYPLYLLKDMITFKPQKHYKACGCENCKEDEE